MNIIVILKINHFFLFLIYLLKIIIKFLSDFYMGKAEPIDAKQTTILNDNGETLPIVNFKLKLDHMAREDIFSYFQD